MLKELENLPYFTLNQLTLLCRNKNITKVNVSRRLKSEKILKIKRWIYITNKKFLEISYSSELNNFIEYITTNLIYTPSYLSTEYILFKNNVLTENVYNITGVTTKKTAKFENKFWNFSYKSIKKDLFFGYKIIKKWEFSVYESSVEKALFDYIYFKKNIIWDIDYFRELRLNLQNINFEKLEKIITKSNNKKMKKVFKYLNEIKWY